jgi:hypothetical protein
VDDEVKQSPRCCTTRRDEEQRRLQLVSFLMNGLLLRETSSWNPWNF